MERDEFHIGYRDREGNPTNANPKQELAEKLFFDKDVDGLLLVGGQNSGKTMAAAKIGVVEAMMMYPGIQIGIGHVDYGALEGSLIAKLILMLDRTVTMPDGTKQKLMVYRTGKRDITITIPGHVHPQRGYTAYIKCVPLDPRKGLDEFLNVKGVEFGVFIWDQAEWMRETGRRVWQAIVARTRIAPAKVIMTANPEVDAWFDEIFLDTTSPSYSRLRTVLMNPADNAFKDDRYMERMRETLPERDYERYIQGKSISLRRRILNYNWDKYGFDEWGRIPDGYDVWGIFDFGQRDPTVYQLWAVCPKGHCYLFASLKIMGDDAEIDYVAKQVNDITYDWLHRGRAPHERIPNFRGIRCDPSLLAHKNSKVRKSIQQLFKESGLIMHPAPIIGRNREGQVKTEITIITNLHTSGKLHICRNQDEFRREEESWTWAKNGKDEPGDWRKYGADGETVIHHFDNMACLRYFGATFKANLGSDDVELPTRPTIDQIDYDPEWSDIGGKDRSDDPRGYFEKLIYSRQ